MQGGHPSRRRADPEHELLRQGRRRQDPRQVSAGTCLRAARRRDAIIAAAWRQSLAGITLGFSQLYARHPEALGAQRRASKGDGRRAAVCSLVAPPRPIIHAIPGLPEIATIDAQVGYSRPEWLASLAPQDDGFGLLIFGPTLRGWSRAAA